MKTLVFFSALAASSIPLAQTLPPTKLGMEEAVAFAMENSPTLKGAKAEVDAARAMTGAARSRLGPQVGLNGFFSQGSMPMILQSAMGFEPQSLVMSPEDEFADANLMLMMPLYTGGLLSGQVSAAFAREQAARFEASGMAAEVAFMVRESYAQALYGVSLVEAMKARVEAAEAMAAQARAMFEAGKGIEASVRRAEAERADAQQELTMAENDRQKMLLDLLAQMGASLEALPELTEALVFRQVEGTLHDYLRRAKEKRGELLAARKKEEAERSDARSKAGALSPQVYGFAMGDSFNPRDEMGRRSGYTVGVVASIPIFDSGMRRSETAAARAMAEKAKADADRVELQVLKEVRQAWLDVQTAAQNYQTAQSALAAAESAYETMRVRVEAGKAILVEQLDALAALTRARTALAKALLDHEVAKARLARTTGETTLSPTGGTSK